ncbi:UNVERIFIED_CONTAM: hypothetical protein K2H54_066552 [Gekko kuhli]
MEHRVKEEVDGSGSLEAGRQLWRPLEADEEVKTEEEDSPGTDRGGAEVKEEEEEDSLAGGSEASWEGVVWKETELLADVATDGQEADESPLGAKQRPSPQEVKQEGDRDATPLACIGIR